MSPKPNCRLSAQYRRRPATEGIDFQCGWGPVRVEGTDAVSGLAVKACLSVKDASGAFRPSFDEAQTRTIPADAVIFAIGQAADLDPFAEDVAITPRRTIETAAVTFETSRPDVFAAGDAASGPASAIQAIAGGREAAFSMDRYLRGGQILANRAAVRETVDKDRLPGEGVLLSPRNERAVTDAPGFGERPAGAGSPCRAGGRYALHDLRGQGPHRLQRRLHDLFHLRTPLPGGSHQRASFQGTAPAYP